MNHNPYESPDARRPTSDRVLISGEIREDLIRRERWLKWVLVAYTIVLVIRPLLDLAFPRVPEELARDIGTAYLWLIVGISLIAFAVVIWVGQLLYRPITVGLLSLLTLIPLVGVFVLVGVDIKASSLIKGEG